MSELDVTLLGERAMVEFGQRLGQACGMGVVVFLEGDLGMGKTTLCRGVLQAFGHQSAVKSPTYTLVEPYDLAEGTVCHFDLYRLASPEELEYMGIRDYFSGNNLCLVEWPAQGEGFLPQPDLIVRIALVENGRTLSLTALSQAGETILATLNKS
jgi:tRNA threonylcarbamoyladenosine biosynthesis protein TsaE